MDSDPINTPGSHGKALFICCFVFLPMSMTALALRLYCRICLMKSGLGKDDVAAMFTMVCMITFSATLAVSTHHGFGLHIWQMTPDTEKMWFEYITITSPPYVLAVGGYKATLLFLYLRIFKARPVYRWLCIGGLVVVIATSVANVFTQLLGCQPLRKFWDKKVPGHCMNYIPANEAYNTLYVLADFYVAFLPVPMVWQLQMKKQNKIHLTLIFGIGILAFMCALIRFIVGIVDQHSYDRFGIAAITYIWSNIELNVGLTCACVPTLKPLFTKVKGQLSGRSSQKTSNIPRASDMQRNLSGQTAVSGRVPDFKSMSVRTIESV